MSPGSCHKDSKILTHSSYWRGNWRNDELTVMCLIPRFLFKLTVSCPQTVAHTLTNHSLRWNNFILRKAEEESIFSLLGMHDLLVLKYKVK